MSEYECKYCHSFRKHESAYVIDAERKILDIQYECGTILKITFPKGVYDWFRNCNGISSHRLDKSKKLPDK